MVWKQFVVVLISFFSEGNSYSLKRGKWRAGTLVIHWRWLKSDQTCTQANMLAAFPLSTARDRRWWSHCLSLGSPDMSTCFFARQLKQGAMDLPYTHLVAEPFTKWGGTS